MGRYSLSVQRFFAQTLAASNDPWFDYWKTALKNCDKCFNYRKEKGNSDDNP
jgi:hypothetical protein